MRKIFCIIGETGSGKDTLIKEMSKKFNIPQVVSYTTRPKRENEENGREHYFISNKEMDEFEKREDLLAWTKIGEFRYCATVESIGDVAFYLIDPTGVRWLREHIKTMDIEIITIYIHVPLMDRMARCRKRSDFKTSFQKRVVAETLDFAKARTDCEFDYLITNKDLATTINILSAIISEYL